MDNTAPITKYQARIRNDHKGTTRYLRRPDIDRLLEARRLEQQLREPLT